MLRQDAVARVWSEAIATAIPGVPSKRRLTVVSDQVLMSIQLVTGLYMTGGLAFQLWTGMRMHRADSQRRQGLHKLVGYSVLIVAAPHLPIGILDVLKAFTG